MGSSTGFRTFHPILVLALILIPSLNGEKRKVTNYMHGRDAVVDKAPASASVPAPSLTSGTMEDILDTPRFRDRLQEVAEDPNVWSEALSEYDKLLSTSQQGKVIPKVNPLAFSKPEVLVPFSPGKEVEPREKKESAHHHDSDDHDHKAKKDTPKPSPTTTTTSKPKLGKIIEENSPKNKRNSSPDTETGPEPASNTCPRPSTNDEVRENKNFGSLKNLDEITVHERLLPNSIMTTDMLYGMCGGAAPDGKVCYGVPSSCIPKKVCRLIVTFGRDGADQIKVNLAGESSSSGFVAFGFSKDRFIGDDILVYCINVAKEFPNNYIALYSATTDGLNSKLQKNRHNYEANFCPDFGYENHGVLACSFKMSTKLILDDGNIVDLLKKPYYTMLAFGHYFDNKNLINDSNYGALKYQHLVEFTDKARVLEDELMAPQNIEPRTKILLQLHIGCGVIAFVFLIPAGMFMAKYGKEVLGYQKRVMGRFMMPMWQWVHLQLVILSLILTVISIIAILFELDFDWRSHGKYSLFHSCSGTVAVGFYVIAFVSGCFFKKDKNRKGLTWTHWLTGNLAYLSGISSIFVAGSLYRAQATCFVEYFGYIHLFIHIISWIAMAIDTRQLVILIDQQFLFQRAILGPMIPFETKFSSFKESLGKNPWKTRRRFVLFYFITSFLCAFSICVLTVLPTVLCR